ncbi:MAG TPA: PIN domain-containing protein [Candidatus Korarchaeota archaeon]|nr:PIN domain-containing protein [Candidatus Korarchaeota archaeon]
MRLVDASVFVHAFLRPKRKLQHHERRIKESAKSIVRRINEGEEVAMTVVQLAEVANLLETHLPREMAAQVEEFLVRAPNVSLLAVDRRACSEALTVSIEHEVGLSDAIAYVVMLSQGIREIYSFDRDFDRLPGIVRLTE